MDAALYEVAVLYENGLGRPSDDRRALTYYQRAANVGIREAAERLAKIYADGELGEARNLDESEKWLKAAVK